MSTIETTRQALPTGTWNADPVHSHVGFAVDYVVGTFRGTFSPVRRDARRRRGRRQLSGSAPVAGIKVQDENLAAHLQSPDFFDAERAPELRFESTEITRDGDRVDGRRADHDPRRRRSRSSSPARSRDPADDPFGGVRFQLVARGHGRPDAVRPELEQPAPERRAVARERRDARRPSSSSSKQA